MNEAKTLGQLVEEREVTLADALQGAAKGVLDVKIAQANGGATGEQIREAKRAAVGAARIFLQEQLKQMEIREGELAAVQFISKEQNRRVSLLEEEKKLVAELLEALPQEGEFVDGDGALGDVSSYIYQKGLNDMRGSLAQGDKVVVTRQGDQFHRAACLMQVADGLKLSLIGAEFVE